MTISLILIILVLAAGFYMSWNIGANDVSNAMGTSVGTGALTLKKAVIIAAVLEFSGAFLMGSNVSETLQKGIIDLGAFASDPTTLLIGMFSALLATAIWLQLASYCGWPVSTTHAIVGAIVGFGIIAGGFGAVHWGEVGFISASWVISPIMSAIVAFIFFTAIQKKILHALQPIDATKRLIPYLVFIVVLTFFMTSGFTGIKSLNLNAPTYLIFLGAFLIALFSSIISSILIRKVAESAQGQSSSRLKNTHQIFSLNKALKHLQRLKLASSGSIREEVSASINSMRSIQEQITKPNTIKSMSEYETVEKMFVYMQILSACFVAFAHGANDVANAIGPVASAVEIIRNPTNFAVVSKVPTWLLALGGIGIVVGLATWGWRVIETIGKKITALTPTRGFCAEFGAAATILIASKLGMPVSTTHCIVGAVFGVGIAKGISALNLGMLKDIILSWIITIPSSAIACVIIFKIIMAFIGSKQLI
ncbi:MAG: inorganic phosphate transporter [Rhabdochlamydiaceae bacterium]|nr:inorganic phosphate transporter [Candidatus Amphrikana amoebophyrae]